MREPQSITAISGWALPPEWFEEQIRQVFPDKSVNGIYPLHPEDSREAKNLLKNLSSDLIIGYSLGSLWLAKYQKFLPGGCQQKVLLAPILAFPKEENKGGITNKTQLKYLTRVLKQNSQNSSSLVEFFKDCKIVIPEHHLKNIPCREALMRGLNFLARESIHPGSLESFQQILIGECDHLLDPYRLKQLIPNLRVIKNAGHGLGPLLQNIQAQLISIQPNPDPIL
jgi:hypothetical protein